MTLFCTKKLRAVSFFDRLLEPVFFLPISLFCLSI